MYNICIYSCVYMLCMHTGMCIQRIVWCVYIRFMFAEGVYVCTWGICMHDIWMFIGCMFM